MATLALACLAPLVLLTGCTENATPIPFPSYRPRALSADEAKQVGERWWTDVDPSVTAYNLEIVSTPVGILQLRGSDIGRVKLTADGVQLMPGTYEGAEQVLQALQRNGNRALRMRLLLHGREVGTVWAANPYPDAPDGPYLQYSGESRLGLYQLLTSRAPGQ